MLRELSISAIREAQPLSNFGGRYPGPIDPDTAASTNPCPHPEYERVAAEPEWDVWACTSCGERTRVAAWVTDDMAKALLTGGRVQGPGTVVVIGDGGPEAVVPLP